MGPHEFDKLIGAKLIKEVKEDETILPDSVELMRIKMQSLEILWLASWREKEAKEFQERTLRSSMVCLWLRGPFWPLGRPNASMRSGSQLTVMKLDISLNHLEQNTSDVTL